MEQFSIIGNGESLTLEFMKVFGFPNSTFHEGGYDVKANITIDLVDYKVNSSLYISTGRIYEFVEHLKTCNQNLNGFVLYNSYEANLELKLQYDNQGSVKVSGNFQESLLNETNLIFEFDTDQSYITQTISELELIVRKY